MNGSLELLFGTPGLEPGATFDLRLISADSIDGQFATVPARHRGGGLFADIVYEPDAVGLSVIQAVAGDANGDGHFNPTDLVDVFLAGEYEDAIAANSTWLEGDWNGDQEFDSADVIVAFQFGAYSNGASAKAPIVPEPATSPWQIAIVLGGHALDATSPLAQETLVSD